MGSSVAGIGAGELQGARDAVAARQGQGGGGGLWPVAGFVPCCLSLHGAPGAPSKDGNSRGALEALVEWDVDKPLLSPHCTRIKPEFDSSRYGWPGSAKECLCVKGLSWSTIVSVL